MLGKALLQKVCEFDATDFALGDDQYEKLLEASGSVVTVECEATDGYYDITLADGTEYHAIAGYHLKGYDEPDRGIAPRMVESTNLMNGARIMIPAENKGTCCDPGTETYWSM